MIPAWMRGNVTEEVKQKSNPTNFKDMSLEKFRSVVHGMALSNSDVESEAVSKADSASFFEANKLWFKRTDKNAQLVNHVLKSQGKFDHTTFLDIQAAADDLAAQGLLDIDEAGYAQHLDGVRPRTYKGANGVTYDSLESLIPQNRNVTLTKVREQSKEEIDLEGLPIEEQQAILKAAEHGEMLTQSKPLTQMNADAFLTIRPEIADSTHNANLIRMQLRANGVTDGGVSIEQFDKATKQLRDSGLLTLNKAVLAKQQSAEVKRLASEAAAEPGSVFDTTSLEEMESLDMDELRRRADRQLAGRR